MQPTYRKSGNYYQPAIRHESGRVEVIYGPPLVNIATARKFARFHIQNTKRNK